MKKTGEILRKAREEKGLSLHEVGIFLKINTRILQAIEDGQVEKLPAKTFLRGFIQSYAKYLKLDANYVLKIFSDELRPPTTEVEQTLESPPSQELAAPTGEIANTETPTQEATPALEEKKSTETPLFINNAVSTDSIKQKMLIISVLGFLLVFVVYIGNNLIRRYQKEASLNEDVPVNSQESTEEQLVTSLDAPESAPTAPLDLSITQKQAPTLTSEKKEEPVSVNAPKAVVAPSPTAPTPTPLPAAPTPSSPTSTAAVAPTPSTAPISATAAPPVEKKPEGKPIEVIVEAKENVEIEYSSAKSPPQKLLLKGEQIHTFKSRSGVRLKISNGGAVNVIVNGQDLGAPGALGQSVQLNYE